MTETGQVVSVLPIRVAGRPQPPYQQQLVLLSLVTKHGGYIRMHPNCSMWVNVRLSKQASRAGWVVGGRSSPQARLLGLRGSLTDSETGHGGTEGRGRREADVSQLGVAVAVRFFIKSRVEEHRCYLASICIRFA